MCGIAGIFRRQPTDAVALRDELVRVRDAMAPRGPDGCGIWISDDGLVSLAHRRLAIQDLSDAGAQPMVDEATGCRISYNGEIYNGAELRRGLESRGHRFRSTSDTEVLLRAYVEHAEAMLPMLRGMFAFCIWEPRSRGVLLARDPLGIKPLYYAADEYAVRVASQVKALLAGGGVSDVRPSAAGRAGFYVWGHVPEPYTLYRGIKMLPSGTCAWVYGGRLGTPRQYFDLTATIAQGEREVTAGSASPSGSAHRELRDALARSVSCHLISDVPVGVFLSAGVDSTAIASLVRDCKPADAVRTLTVAFDEYRGSEHDESEMASRLSRVIGTSHSTERVTSADFELHIGHALASMDQPTIDGVNTYFVVKAAREAGLTVVLSGVGGDELFGGYGYPNKIRALRRWSSIPSAVPGLGAALRVLGAPLAEALGKPKGASVVELSRDVASTYLLFRGMMLPWELPRVVDPDEAREGLAELDVLGSLRKAVRGISDVSLQLCALDFTFYLRNQLLRDSDWASMAHSVELRTPLVDAWLMRDIMRLRAAGLHATKAHFCEAVNPKVHEVLRNRPKTGFSIPVTQWMPKELRDRAGRGNPYRQWARHVLAAAIGVSGRREAVPIEVG
jgi:asparagine synthase (glutamine-hydrolysing)